VPLAIRQHAPLLERHPPRKPPLQRAQFSSHGISHPAPQGGEGGPPEGRWKGRGRRRLLCLSERTNRRMPLYRAVARSPSPALRAGADKQNRFAARPHAFSPHAGRRSG
jgi:hypothetical protein